MDRTVEGTEQARNRNCAGGRDKGQWEEGTSRREDDAGGGGGGGGNSADGGNKIKRDKEGETSSGGVNSWGLWMEPEQGTRKGKW